MSLSSNLNPLQSTWTTLYTQTLPALARANAPSQPHWPVHLDHCFARIILDAVIGAPTATSPATPWTARLKSPAVKNMAPQQLEECIQLGEDVKFGRVNLVELDQQSLNVRGEMKGGGKRKTAPGDAMQGFNAKKTKVVKKEERADGRTHQPSILAAMGLPTLSPSNSPSSSSSSTPPPPAATIPDDLRDLITTSGLTEFRQQVLLRLCQIPEGYFSTYLALASHFSSAPRAVGNALRNNPFAPRVPCHRVVAADGGIGGFNGEWGDAGKYCKEKVGLLKGEGVVIKEKKGKTCVEGKVWEGFV